MADNNHPKSIIVQTVITALAVIASSVISVVLTNHYNMKALEVSEKRQTERINLAGKLNLESVILSNKTNKQMNDSNIQNALKLAEMSINNQQKADKRREKIEKRRKEESAARLYFSDISVRVEILISYYNSIKDYALSFSSTPQVMSILGFEGISISRQVLTPDDIDSWRKESLSDIGLDCGIQIVRFFESARQVKALQKIISSDLTEKFLSRPSGQSKLSKEEASLHVKTYFSMMNLLRQALLTSILTAIESGNRALTTLNFLYIKDNNHTKGLQTRSRDTTNEKEKRLAKFRVASQEYNKLVEQIAKIRQSEFDQILLKEFGTKLSKPK